MCGIAGFIDIKGTLDRKTIHAVGAAMHKAIAHRGPDDFDVWQDPDVPLILTHRRLSIIDLSPEGRQPMHAASGRYVMVYNGEIYNYLELRAQLEDMGHVFKGRSDTEVMLAAIDQWGLNEILQKINGMFAIVLWDRQERQMHFIRDRFGKKPLYVGWAGSCLVFSSELKSFHQHPHFKADISAEGITNYFRYGYLCAPFTIYQNVWQMLPASRLSFRIDRISTYSDLSERMEPYWFMPRVIDEAREVSAPENEEDVIDDFEARLKTAVRQRLVSDVPLGAFLSGGIDSSIIVALMQQNASSPVKTFSIRFSDRDYNEADHASTIASYLGTQHKEFTVTPDEAMAVIPNLPVIYDEPFADASQIPTYLVSKLAKESVTVALTGDGGDELLGGYDRHFMVPAIWKKIGWIPPIIRGIGGHIIHAVPENVLNKLQSHYPQFGRRLKKLATITGKDTAHDVYAALVSAWEKPESIVLNAKEPMIPLTDPLWQPQEMSFTESMIYGDALSYRPNDVMVKVDRAGMAVALEARAPLMDYKLFEYCATLPVHMKVRGMSGKWLLKQVLKKHVPETLTDRPKMGFNVPVNQWVRGPLKDWAGDLLNTDRIRAQGYLNAGAVEKLWQTHIKSGHTNGNALWTVLMFQAWMDKWKP